MVDHSKWQVVAGIDIYYLVITRKVYTLQRTEETDHDLDHLDRNLPFWDVRDLYRSSTGIKQAAWGEFPRDFVQNKE